MRRTNLILNERLLDEVTRIPAARTYPAAVNTALEKVIRLRRIQTFQIFLRPGIWESDLAEMREDRPRRKKKRK